MVIPLKTLAAISVLWLRNIVDMKTHSKLLEAGGFKYTHQLKNDKIRRNLALRYFEWITYI